MQTQMCGQFCWVSLKCQPILWCPLFLSGFFSLQVTPGRSWLTPTTRGSRGETGHRHTWMWDCQPPAPCLPFSDSAFLLDWLHSFLLLETIEYNSWEYSFGDNSSATLSKLIKPSGPQFHHLEKYCDTNGDPLMSCEAYISEGALTFTAVPGP